ncbi:MAG TPA: SpoIIE family protein phosphatase [Candidatus Rifleibacterium sp.]|nr:SpoIIE family protein phosphatase [Candidatus Rifleibacterium sp.]
MSAENQYRSASFGRLAMIFAGIMFLVLTLTAMQTAEKIDRAHERRMQKTLEGSLYPVISSTSDEAFVYNRLMPLVDAARLNGLDSPGLAAAVMAASETFKVPVKAFFYKDLALQKTFNADNSEIKLFSELLADLNMTGPGFAEAQRRVHQSLLSTFGAGHRLELMREAKGVQRRYKFKEGDRFYYWNTWPDGLSVFFIATTLPGFLERFKLAAPDTEKFGAGNPGKMQWLAPAGISEDQAAAAHLKAKLGGQNHTQANDHLWYFLDDETGSCWFRVMPQALAESLQPRWAASLTLVAFALFVAVLLLYASSVIGLPPGSTVCTWLDSLSIRYRVIGLFAMASVFPVLYTTLIGATSLADRREVIENSVIAESIAAIEPLEKMFNIRIAQAEDLNKDLRQALINEPPSEAMFQKYLKKHSLPRYLARLEVRDGDGVTIFSTDDREVHGVAEAMDVFSRMTIKLHAPARMSSMASGKVSPAEIVSESVMSTDEIGMATIMRLRGRQWQFHMGAFPTTWYWDVYPDIATGPGFMCQSNQLLEVYLAQVKETLQKPQTSSDSMQFATELNYQFSSFRVIPHLESIPEKELLQTAIASFRTNRILFREIEADGQTFWATCKPEKIINSHVFMHLISQPARLRSLEPFKWRLLTGGVFALVISLLGALLITRLIILPIGDLSDGIRAIRERRQDFRIPVRRNDELGAVSLAFNKVIGELKELEYGRIVQESLLPAAPIVPAGYDIAFFKTSATDLAGDYHDCVMLDDGRLAIILGDVTGHGISAALAMAMAKATVNYAAADGRLFPVGLMDMLNALFNRELKPRHKFMTLVTVVIDPVSGAVQVDNAGQSYPRFYCAASDSSAEIELPTMPLGAMKKRKAKIETRTMRSGDAIILYTDGIIECSDTTGDMYGYERFRTSFEDLMRQKTGADAALISMMRQLDAFRVPGPYPDDVTLVIIRKL